MFAVGLLDDQYNLPPGVKLLGQGVAGIGLASSVLRVQRVCMGF